MVGLVPVSALAQVQTLKEAAQQVIQTNPEVLARWHSYKAADSERDVAVGAYLPRVDVAAGAGRDRLNEPLISTDLTRKSTTLTLTQLIWDGFATSNEIKRLDYARRTRLFELYDITESAALEAARAYVDVLRFRTLVTLAEENYVRHKSVFEQIQKKAAAGVARRVDLEQASGRLALAESNLLTETANLHDVSARFQRIIGATPRRNMENPALLKTGIPVDMPSALRTAGDIHPALQAAIENVRSADRAASVRNGSFQPRFDFRVRSEYADNLGGTVGTTRNNVAEVVMSWNLFSGGSDMARVRQFADLLNVARDQRDKVCRDLRQTLAIAYNDIRKLNEQLTYLDQHQLSIEKARDAYRKQFDIGQRTLLDVLDTENELFQARRAYTNAEYDLHIAYARTHAGMGTLFSALGLSRLPIEKLPDLGRDEANNVEGCPAEGPDIYIADKKALNERAQELLRESGQNAGEAYQNGGAAPQAPAPLPRTAPGPGLQVPPAQRPSAPGNTPGIPTPSGPSRSSPGASPGSSLSPSSALPQAAIVPAVFDSRSAGESKTSGKRALIDALNGWANAWSGRDAAAFLATYAPEFRPANGLRREAWSAQRRKVLQAAGQIELGISKVQIEMQSGDRAQVSFVQQYRSLSYADTVAKTLEWARVGERWLIVSETAAPVRQ